MKKELIIIFVFGIICTGLNAQQFIGGIEVKQNIQNNKSVEFGDCDTIYSFPTISFWPVGLTSDGSYFYSSTYHEAVIYKYSLDGQFVDTIPLPTSEGGGDLDFDGTYLWYVIEQLGKIYKIDPSTGDSILSFSLPTRSSTDPNNFGCAFENGFIWISEYVNQTLMRINATNGSVVDSFAINRKVLPLKIINGELYGIEYFEYSPDSYVQLNKFDKSTGALIDSLQWCIPYPLGFYQTQNNMWALSSGLDFGTERIYKFDWLLAMISESVKIIDTKCYPNPFSSSITLEYSLSSSHHVTLSILNHMGELVHQFQDYQQPGKQQIRWDAGGQPAGIYFYRLNAGEQIATGKLVLMK